MKTSKKQILKELELVRELQTKLIKEQHYELAAQCRDKARELTTILHEIECQRKTKLKGLFDKVLRIFVMKNHQAKK